MSSAGLFAAILLALEPSAAPGPASGASAPAQAVAKVVSAQAVKPTGWNTQRTPAPGPPRVIGAVTGGCLQGAATLPASGPGYEALRLQRNRRFGHPELVAYVRRLAAAAKKAKLGLLVVGDLSQPRGGPTPSGHRSHQSGLDVDMGYVAPAGVRGGHLASRDRERLSPPAVIDLRTHEKTPAWGARTVELLALAAGDAAVDRIFVNPAIKQMLCEGETHAAPWNARVRPWWGHHDHFHVRLKCPGDSPDCKPQEPPPGDGCGPSLAWWFSPDAEATRTRRKQAADEAPAGPRMPEGCAALLGPAPDAAAPAVAAVPAAPAP